MQKIHFFDTGPTSFNFMKNSIYGSGNRITYNIGNIATYCLLLQEINIDLMTNNFDSTSRHEENEWIGNITFMNDRPIEKLITFEITNVDKSTVMSEK